MYNKIEIRGLSKRFGDKIVLDNLDLDIEANKSIVILGRSGTGKSVLVKNILHLIEPDSGTIKIDGEDTTNISESRQFKLMNKFGFLFQGGALFDSMTVWENIAFKLINNEGYSRDRAKKIAEEKLEIVDLKKDILDLNPSALSGGMQKRVALARALVGNPEIIIFDEPTTGLDPITADTINDLIIKTNKITKATAITITHDIHSAKRISDRIVLLDEGKIKWDGNSDDLNKTTNEMLKQFIYKQ